MQIILIKTLIYRCAADHMASVRVEMSTTLEKLLDKLTALEQYEETLTEPHLVSSVDQLTQVTLYIMFVHYTCFFLVHFPFFFRKFYLLDRLSHRNALTIY